MKYANISLVCCRVKLDIASIALRIVIGAHIDRNRSPVVLSVEYLLA